MNTSPVRILHVIGIMDRGGAETMIMNLYRHIDRSLIQFDFVENTEDAAAYDDEISDLGGRIYRCPHYNGKNHLAYVAWWKRFFSEHEGEFSAVHGHLGSTAAIYLGIAKKHGLYTIAHSHNTGIPSLRNAVYSAYAYPTRHIADYFFGCSQEAGLSRYGEKVCANPTKFAVLHNAIDTKRFSFDPDKRSEIREKLDLQDKLVIGHVGRFFAQKNHRFLIEVFDRIRRSEPQAVLLLVGDGELRPGIEERIRVMGLADSVVFAGVQADVSSFYQAMDVFLFPSRYEGLGIAVVEAQCSGLPIILSEDVPEECDLIPDLITRLSLQKTADDWAAETIRSAETPRKDRSAEVAQCGYDISETAQWMERFYLGIAEGRNATR